MLVPLKNMAGSQVGEVELDDGVFGAPVRDDLMHQALVRQLSNARLGTHKTKTRGEVKGGGRKPWRQKGTGRARQGSTRSPNWVGGGTVFGPRPHKYIKRMPKKMHHAALRSALSAKAHAGKIIVVDELAMNEPKTKAMLQTLNALGIDRSALLVMAEKDQVVQRSASNLPQVKTLLSSYVNVRDLLGHDTLVLSKDAVEYLEIWLGVDATTTIVDLSLGDDNETTAAIDDSMDDGTSGVDASSDDDQVDGTDAAHEDGADVDATESAGGEE